ncbi:MAG: sterol desaturase family protein [Hydrococcus sp. RM1_1_31]|nr:sterol desaturase family protein [Hydrococcus sp. RM1_1_31]
MPFVVAIALIFLLFIFLEKRYPLHRKKTFRQGWLTDLTHYFVNQYLVDVGVFLLAIPLYVLLGWAIDNPLSIAIATQSASLQFLEAVIIAELAFYWIHRAAHTILWLWRFHAIHHSSEQLDFLSAVRFHPIEMAIARVGVGLPLVLLGFSAETFGWYLIWNALNSVFIHANIRWQIPMWMWWIVVAPRYHHWHHSKDILNKNFGHPLIDLLFGTFYYSSRKIPMGYGITEIVPSSYWGQLRYPWKKKKN